MHHITQRPQRYLVPYLIHRQRSALFLSERIRVMPQTVRSL